MKVIRGREVDCTMGLTLGDSLAAHPVQLPTAHAAVNHSLRAHFLIGLAIILAAVLIELAMGRTVISKSGTIKLWVSETNGAETSQQVADWYSFTHITHGILLYALF